MIVLSKKIKKNLIYICLSIVLLIIGIFFRTQQKNPLSFSTKKWINEDATERYRMLDDLISNYNLIGMHSDEVKILLGNYSIRHKAFTSDAGSVDYYWGYIIRYDNWEGKEVLLIGFKDDIVVKYELVYLSEL